MLVCSGGVGAGESNEKTSSWPKRRPFPPRELARLRPTGPTGWEVVGALGECTLPCSGGPPRRTTPDADSDVALLELLELSRDSGE